MFKKSTTKQSKAILALSIALIALIAFTSAITFAYFTDKTGDISSSELKFGEMNLKLNDAQNADRTLKITECDTPIVPGCEMSLSGSVTIETTINAVVKFELTLKVGETSLELPTISGLTAETGGALKITLTEHGGAYYGFITKNADGTAQDIVDLSKIKIIIPTTFTNTYQGKTLKVTLGVTAIQAEHTGAGSNASDIIASSTAEEMAAAFTKVGNFETVAD